jgi:hypothetical protein
MERLEMSKVKITSENNNIPPYVAKRFKLIPKEIDEDKGEITFDYVEKPNKDEHNDIAFLLTKKLKFSKNISEEEYNSKFEELYPDVSNNNETQEESSKEVVEEEVASVYGYDNDPEPEVMDMTQFIHQIPTETLEKELRNRYLSQQMTGLIVVTKDGVQFQLEELKWPNGAYKVKIDFSEDITQEFNEQQKKAAQNKNEESK